MPRTHGASGTHAHTAWRSMLNRCYCPGQTSYEDYGGRGVKVCKRWRGSFEAFLEDVGLPPTRKHTLDRKDSDGHYKPDNVQWVIHKDQCRNRSSNRKLTLAGETKLLCEWAEALGIQSDTITRRIDKLGWTVEKALTTSVDTTKRNGRVRPL